jgi:hypothetical protein
MKNLILCLALSVCSLGNAALPFGSQFNGEYWKSLNEKAKLVFLEGFCVGANLHGEDGFGTPQRPFTLYPEQIPKIVPLIDAFYKTHASDELLSDVTEICLMQLVGRPQAEIDVKSGYANRACK